MKSIFIDITSMLHVIQRRNYTPYGIARVMIAYIQYFQDRARAFVQWNGKPMILSKEDSDHLFQLILQPANATDSSLDCIQRHHKKIGRRFFLRKRPLKESAALFQDAVLFVLNHAPVDFAYLRRANIAVVYMLHDLIPLQYPEYCHQETIRQHEKLIYESLGELSGIITNSQATHDEFLAFRDQKQLKNVPPILPSLIASNISTIKPQAAFMKKPYFVVIAAIEGRKNYFLLLHLWRQLVRDKGADSPVLVVIGCRGAKAESVFDLLDECTILKEAVEELSSCSDEMLITYLCHAQALLYPSFSEGYGLPLVEALSQRTPVIASDLPVFREIAGDIPEYADPLDGARWRALIDAYSCADSPMRKAQLDRMETLKLPTWEAHFTKVETFIQSLHHSQPR